MNSRTTWVFKQTLETFKSNDYSEESWNTLVTEVNRDNYTEDEWIKLIQDNKIKEMTKQQLISTKGNAKSKTTKIFVLMKTLTKVQSSDYPQEEWDKLIVENKIKEMNKRQLAAARTKANKNNQSDTVFVLTKTLTIVNNKDYPEDEWNKMIQDNKIKKMTKKQLSTAKSNAKSRSTKIFVLIDTLTEVRGSDYTKDELDKLILEGKIKEMSKTQLGSLRSKVKQKEETVFCFTGTLKKVNIQDYKKDEWDAFIKNGKIEEKTLSQFSAAKTYSKKKERKIFVLMKNLTEVNIDEYEKSEWDKLIKKNKIQEMTKSQFDNKKIYSKRKNHKIFVLMENLTEVNIGQYDINEWNQLIQKNKIQEMTEKQLDKARFIAKGNHIKKTKSKIEKMQGKIKKNKIRNLDNKNAEKEMEMKKDHLAEIESQSSLSLSESNRPLTTLTRKRTRNKRQRSDVDLADFPQAKRMKTQAVSKATDVAPLNQQLEESPANTTTSTMKFSEQNEVINNDSVCLQPESVHIKAEPVDKLQKFNWLKFISHDELILKLREAAKILIGNKASFQNCDVLADNFINFLKTGVMPTNAIPDQIPSTLPPIVTIRMVPLKHEPGQKQNSKKIGVTTRSRGERDKIFSSYVPPSTHLYQDKVINDLEDYKEIPIHYSKLEAILKRQALMHPDKIAFGKVGLERSETTFNKTVKTSGHAVVYLVIGEKVIYIDCARYNGSKHVKSGEPIIQTALRNAFYFAGDKNQKTGEIYSPQRDKVYGFYVFITPMSSSFTYEVEIVDISSDVSDLFNMTETTSPTSTLPALVSSGPSPITISKSASLNIKIPRSVLVKEGIFKNTHQNDTQFQNNEMEIVINNRQI